MIRRRDVIGLMVRVRRQADAIRLLEAERDAALRSFDIAHEGLEELDAKALALEWLLAEARWQTRQLTTAVVELGPSALAARLADRAELIEMVRDYAETRYERGWDVVVDTFSDDQIGEVIGQAQTLKGALAEFDEIVYMDIGEETP